MHSSVLLNSLPTQCPPCLLWYMPRLLFLTVGKGWCECRRPVVHRRKGWFPERVFWLHCWVSHANIDKGRCFGRAFFFFTCSIHMFLHLNCVISWQKRDSQWSVVHSDVWSDSCTGKMLSEFYMCEYGALKLLQNKKVCKGARCSPPLISYLTGWSVRIRKKHHHPPAFPLLWRARRLHPHRWSGHLKGQETRQQTFLWFYKSFYRPYFLHKSGCGHL